MQQSVVPELAHTDSRPMHWLATATALTGVVALSSLFQPGAAKAAQSSAGTEPKPTPAATAPPSTAGVDFPLDCGPVKEVVVKKATGDLDGDGRPETVAVVHCDSAMGTPPDGVYVLTQAAGATRPRVVATLVDPKDRITVTDFTVAARRVTANLLGYSSDNVPSCCPDVKTAATWQWNGRMFARSAPAASSSV
ncbi:hypothetical protein [Streptomyces sp. NPDC059224]|uniref:hypothetical protein n=1 Tax=Streptomyces sp. NPDC059224 TaxID=3346775 RepID=UPI00368E075D